jgi:23S rRNA pseudouridine1911/1915/1917 synthase
MENRKMVIRVDRSGIDKRLDIFLSEGHPQLTSRSHIKKLIDDGCVLVNDQASKPHHKLRNGDVITIDLSKEKKNGPVLAEDVSLDILHEDDYLLVVNKPAGMAAHPSPGANSGTLVNALLYHAKKLSHVGPKERPGIVHRLDKDTSGLMVVAKDDGTHRQLSEQFKERKINKRYIAFVNGVMELDKGLIELPIGRHPSQRQKQTVRFSESREAVTEYKVIRRFPKIPDSKGRFKGCTMVDLIPKTGRMHQLRVHLSYLGHPILGDATYGERSDLISRQALHAAMLGFVHPATKRYLEFTSDIPPDMKRLNDFFLEAK